MVLEVKNLKAYFNTPEGLAKAVDDISFSISEKEIFCLVGESGCGKSVTALSLMNLLPEPAAFIPGGEILLDGQDLLKLSQKEMRAIRGSKISMVFQEPGTALNPVLSVGNQVAEVFRLHQNLSRGEAKQMTVEMFRLVKIALPEIRYHEYPHQLSGGMKQRVIIAMALACKPRLIIADEPTTALDVTIQAQVLSLLEEIRDQMNAAILLITHDLGVVNQMADRVGVMYAGKLVEVGEASVLIQNPRHPYTKKLLESYPSEGARNSYLPVIQGSVPPATRYGEGCHFLDRCPLGSAEDCGSKEPVLEEVGPDQRAACFKLDIRESGLKESRGQDLKPQFSEEIALKAQNIKVYFPVRKGLFKKTVGYIRAVDGLDLQIPKGGTTALVGESGCGKSTFGKALMNLIPLTDGMILFKGFLLQSKTPSFRKAFRRGIQLIFQDPYGSLNPRMKVAELLVEGPKAHGKFVFEARLKELLNMVSLDTDSLERYPHEFSGGQRQRLSIARALAMEPEFLILDEATSALDVSVQAQILNLLKKLQKEWGLTYLFITHDLSVVETMADWIAVMYLGQIVEYGEREAVLKNPRHPYTKALLESALRLHSQPGKLKVLEGEIPSPMDPPKGCRFHPRCRERMDRCEKEVPKVYEAQGRQTRCFLFEEGTEAQRH